MTLAQSAKASRIAAAPALEASQRQTAGPTRIVPLWSTTASTRHVDRDVSYDGIRINRLSTLGSCDCDYGELTGSPSTVTA